MRMPATRTTDVRRPASRCCSTVSASIGGKRDSGFDQSQPQYPGCRRVEPVGTHADAPQVSSGHERRASVEQSTFTEPEEAIHYQLSNQPPQPPIFKESNYPTQVFLNEVACLWPEYANPVVLHLTMVQRPHLEHGRRCAPSQFPGPDGRQTRPSDPRNHH